MLYIKKIGLILVIALAPMLARGQVTARVSGLERNPKYMSLLLQEKQLHNTEDSIVKTIDNTRKLFAAEPEQREKYSKDILRLEGELFDVRNRIGLVVGSISSIEQEFVISNLNTPPPPPQSTSTPQQTTVPQDPTVTNKQVANLIDNDFFRKNLPPSDYDALRQAQQMVGIPPLLIGTYISNYKKMKALAQTYATAPRPEAESAYETYRVIESLNKHLEDSLSKVWGFIYDNKFYTYNFLFDQANKGELLADFETQFRETNQVIASARDQVASEVVYGYPLRKKLILSCEIALAEMLNYTQAQDSLGRVLKAQDTLTYNLPKIEMTPRNFIPYADITVSTTSVYNAQHPIPAMEIFKRGVVYMVQIGIFTRQQPVSTFRFTSPLCYEKLEDGRFRYCVGAFRTQSEAEAGLEQMKKIGFRTPEIVVWRDGVFENLGNNASTGEAIYRVEIDGEGDALSAPLREILESSVPDKEVSRITSADGMFIYRVGMFENRTSAQALVDQISRLNTVSAKVVVVEN